MKEVLHAIDDRTRQQILRYLDRIGTRCGQFCERNKTFQRFIFARSRANARFRQACQRSRRLQQILLFPDRWTRVYDGPTLFDSDEELVKAAAAWLEVSEEDIVESAGDSYSRYFRTYDSEGNTASEYTLTYTARSAIRGRLKAYSHNPNIFIA